MKRKLTAVLAALSMLLMVTGCLEDETGESSAPASEPEVISQAESQEESSEEEPPEEDERYASGVSLKLNGDSPIEVTRAPKQNTSMGDPDTWTVFVYLCGTDLESTQGSATGDIQQMLAAETNENVRFVIQTGGTSQWMIDDFSAEQCERWVIADGSASCVDAVELANMGDPSTLANFLQWGVANYPAEKMGVIFWDHGGGSITGACFDELNESDSLSLKEMDDAFSTVYEGMTDQFEFIGFDCCLMGTAETANIMASYARYFYGSQETEPGTGWDYTAILNCLAEDPSVDGAALGKVVADSFYNECALAEQESDCTFTILDLTKFDDFVIAFNDYFKTLFDAASNDLSGVVRGVNAADNFGGNNKTEGYTNMVDLGGIVTQCSDYADGTALLSAMQNCISYNINGQLHENASGLSVYYPLQVGGSEELKIYSEIAMSPYYMSLVDMIAKGFTEGGYTNAIFFTEDGDWDNSGDIYDESYFDYADEEGDETSALITFASEPAVDENGVYCFQLDESGLQYAASVEAFIYMDLNEDSMIELGETYDINADWETGVFSDNFDGYWLALPDGQLLATYIVDADENGIVYTSPIMLNGESSNLRIVVNESGASIEGAWSGIDENGIPARDIRALEAGDVIAPVYDVISIESEDSTITADDYTWADGDDIVYAYLPATDYYYGFAVDDVYGDFYISDFVIFSIDEEGNISFVE